MTSDKWDEIKENISKQFEVLDSEQEDMPEERGGGVKDVLIFISPIGKVKLEFVTKPKLLDKKTIYSKRVGQQTKVDYIYSDTETVNTLFAFKWSDMRDDWEEIESSSFA